MNTIKVNRKEITSKSQTPLLDYCRKLICEGVDPESKLEVYRNNLEPDLTIYPISFGAGLTMREEPYLRFVKFNPMSEKDKARLRARNVNKGARSDRTAI